MRRVYRKVSQRVPVRDIGNTNSEKQFKFNLLVSKNGMRFVPLSKATVKVLICLLPL